MIKTRQQRLAVGGIILFLFFYLSSLIFFPFSAKAGEWFIKQPKVTSIEKLVKQIEKFVNAFWAALDGVVVLFIVIAGIRYVIAKSPQEAEVAKGTLINTLIGLAIISGAWGLFSLAVWIAKYIFGLK